MIKLEGSEKLIENIRKALLKHPENKVRQALKRGAKLIVDAAKRNAPVDAGVLRDSIMILPKWRRDPTGMYVGPRVRRRRRKVGGLAEQPFYAAMVEYGTAAHNLGYKGKYVSGKGADHPGSRPKPYMRPAYDTVGQAALNTAIEDIEKMIMNG